MVHPAFLVEQVRVHRFMSCMTRVQEGPDPEDGPRTPSLTSVWSLCLPSSGLWERLCLSFCGWWSKLLFWDFSKRLGMTLAEPTVLLLSSKSAGVELWDFDLWLTVYSLSTPLHPKHRVPLDSIKVPSAQRPTAKLLRVWILANGLEIKVDEQCLFPWLPG